MPVNIKPTKLVERISRINIEVRNIFFVLLSLIANADDNIFRKKKTVAIAKTVFSKKGNTNLMQMEQE